VKDVICIWLIGACLDDFLVADCIWISVAIVIVVITLSFGVCIVDYVILVGFWGIHWSGWLIQRVRISSSYVSGGISRRSSRSSMLEFS